jgi:hypothetical protein
MANNLLLVLSLRMFGAITSFLVSLQVVVLSLARHNRSFSVICSASDSCNENGM